MAGSNGNAKAVKNGKTARGAASLSATPRDGAAVRMYCAAVRGTGVIHLIGASTLAVVAALVTAYLMQPPPVVAYNGRIIIHDPNTGKPIARKVLLPGDKISVVWDQIWSAQCPVEIVPYFTGSDRQPREEKSFMVTARKAGVLADQARELTMGTIPPGDGIYFAVIKPKCWFDVGPLAREFKTEEINFTVDRWTEQLKK